MVEVTLCVVIKVSILVIPSLAHTRAGSVRVAIAFNVQVARILSYTAFTITIHVHVSFLTNESAEIQNVYRSTRMVGLLCLKS